MTTHARSRFLRPLAAAPAGGAAAPAALSKGPTPELELLGLPNAAATRGVRR